MPPHDVSRPARIADRITAIAESATLAVDAKARALRAAGEPVIGFGAGEPDFSTPDHIVQAAVAACQDPRNHHYSPPAGLPELRQAIADKTRRDSGYDVIPDQVVVTNGGKHALFSAMAVLIDEGDEVLLPAPYWTTYPEPVKLAGGRPVAVPTDDASGFRVTIDQLEAALTTRTKALIFVSPSNPTGVVYPPDEVAAIGRWAAERGVWVVTDEMYEHLVYGDHPFSSIATLVPELQDRCVVLNAVSKTYAMTGWRVGWMIGPADVAKAATNLQSQTTSNVANVSQQAALAAVSGGLEAVAVMREAFERRAQAMHNLLSSIPDVSVLKPQGAFYTFPNLSAYLGRDIGGQRAATTVELAALMLDQAKVAVVPGEAFGAPGYARLSFALSDDELREGCGRIVDLLNSAS